MAGEAGRARRRYGVWAFCESVTDVVETVPWQSDICTECPDPVEESTNGPHGPDGT